MIAFLLALALADVTQVQVFPLELTTDNAAVAGCLAARVPTAVPGVTVVTSRAESQATLFVLADFRTRTLMATLAQYAPTDTWEPTIRLWSTTVTVPPARDRACALAQAVLVKWRAARTPARR